MTGPRNATWTIVLGGLFLALLLWYAFYTQQIVRALEEDAATLTRIYAEVQEGLTGTEPGAADQSLVDLQRMIIEAGVPLIWTGPGDTVLAVENLPFETDIAVASGQERVRAYMRALDQARRPVGDLDGNHIHFGDPPAVARLRWIPWLLAGGLALTSLLAATVIRAQRRAEAERAWTAMARELAHQLGTPLSSLQGWLEVLRLPMDERPAGLDRGQIADGLGEDLERLERVSRRFELIGRTPELEEIRLDEILEELERYLQTRLPRIGQGVRLEMDVPEDLPTLRGNRVLLLWALENLVKNALDALAGSGGTIRVTAREAEPNWLSVRVIDDGPGVPAEMRERIFDAGVSTKPGGWGVGLALTRRIVELHGGRIGLSDSPSHGATFQMKLPLAHG